MNDVDIKKTKFKLEIWTFITIIVVVFGLWVTWATLNNKQNQILVKLDEMATMQQQMVTKRDVDHQAIDAKLGYIMPTLKYIAMVYKLPLYEWL
jgi:ABC-type nickel/cobalt efflux system permease component RcnA